MPSAWGRSPAVALVWGIWLGRIAVVLMFSSLTIGWLSPAHAAESQHVSGGHGEAKSSRSVLSISSGAAPNGLPVANATGRGITNVTKPNSAYAAASGPSVANGNFETGTLTGWGASYNSGVTTTNPHSGTYAGQINAPAGGNGSIEQVVTGLAPNTTYTLTGWIRTDGGATILGTKQYNADDDDTGATTTNTGWTQLDNQFTTGPTNTSVDIYCYRSTAGTSACDDFSLVATSAAGAVANGNFETGTLDGWSDSYNAGTTTTNPHSGTYAGQIGAPTDGNGSIEQVVNGLTPNTTYTLTGWIRTDGGATLLGAKQFNAAGDDTGAATSATGWTRLSDEFTTGPANTSVDVYCYRSTAGTSACDDFSLVAIPATGQLTNGDFESGNLALGWSASYNAGTTTSDPHSGDYAGQINAPTGGTGSIEQVVNGLTPNTAYALTGWVRTDGSATSLGAKQYDTAGHNTNATTTNTGWTQLTDQFTTGSSNTSVDIYCQRPTAGTSACDDITLATAPGPVTGLTVTPSSTGATVTWTAPAATGGVALAGTVVEVHASADNSLVTTQTAAAPATSLTLTGLPTGKSLYVLVHAVNASGLAGPAVQSAAFTVSASGLLNLTGLGAWSTADPSTAAPMTCLLWQFTGAHSDTVSGTIHYQKVATGGGTPDATTDWSVTYTAAGSYSGSVGEYSWCADSSTLPASGTGYVWTPVSFTGDDANGGTVSLANAALATMTMLDPDGHTDSSRFAIPAAAGAVRSAGASTKTWHLVSTKPVRFA